MRVVVDAPLRRRGCRPGRASRRPGAWPAPRTTSRCARRPRRSGRPTVNAGFEARHRLLEDHRRSRRRAPGASASGAQTEQVRARRSDRRPRDPPVALGDQAHDRQRRDGSCRTRSPPPDPASRRGSTAKLTSSTTGATRPGDELHAEPVTDSSVRVRPRRPRRHPLGQGHLPALTRSRPDASRRPSTDEVEREHRQRDRDAGDDRSPMDRSARTGRPPEHDPPAGTAAAARRDPGSSAPASARRA